jgi:hypothetical protein
MRKSSAAGLESECRRWNENHPVGTVVKYHPVIGKPEHRVRKVSSPAYVLSGHTPVVMLDGERGCVALAACGVPTDPRTRYNETTLPCPFCGGRAVLQPWHGGGAEKTMVSCENADERCEVEPSVTGETADRAIAVWNKRA